MWFPTVLICIEDNQHHSAHLTGAERFELSSVTGLESVGLPSGPRTYVTINIQHNHHNVKRIERELNSQDFLSSTLFESAAVANRLDLPECG